MHASAPPRVGRRPVEASPAVQRDPGPSRPPQRPGTQSRLEGPGSAPAASAPPPALPAAARQGPAPTPSPAPRDDVRVVVDGAGRAPPRKPPAQEERSLPPDSACSLARVTLLQALYQDLGRSGSMLDLPIGRSFALRGVDGEARSPHRVLVPLPEGRATQHPAALTLELAGGAQLVLDVVQAREGLDGLKALGYDALMLRSVERCFTVLVVVRPEGADEAQALAIGHAYDHSFTVPEANVHEPQAFNALRARIASWLRAAGG